MAKLTNLTEISLQIIGICITYHLISLTKKNGENISFFGENIPIVKSLYRLEN